MINGTNVSNRSACFLFCTPNFWNNLSEHIKRSLKLRSFISRLKTQFLKRFFYFVLILYKGDIITRLLRVPDGVLWLATVKKRRHAICYSKKKKGDMPLHHLNSKNYSVVLLSVETDKTSYVGERAGGPPT